ncbi:hypothetical protein Slala03_72190 [Streptomyces lavendulae subsp. lavendulae]|nr:hypothetical protein Slala03_72190 [Streptomyces lavendulae subsp. lavendulae]
MVTSGLVRALKPGEYEVLPAHGRTHLCGRHHLLSAAVDLAAMVHPAVRGPGKALEFHLEWWATCGRLAMAGSRTVPARAATPSPAAAHVPVAVPQVSHACGAG